MREELSGSYLDRLMRRQSFEALWPLFAKADQPAKEMTESFSALEHLRPLMAQTGPGRCLHIGDGAHARTAALFALKTQADNISIDPIINERIVSSWREQFTIERFSWRAARILDEIDGLNALTPRPTFVTFVHAHVDVDQVLGRLTWDAAFSLACCVKGKQLSRRFTPTTAGEDPNVLSTERQFQLLINPESRWLPPL